jgi:hypothetical protein
VRKVLLLAALTMVATQVFAPMVLVQDGKSGNDRKA